VLFIALNAPPAPFVPEWHRFQPGYAVLATGFGATDEHSRLAARIRESVPPIFEFVGPLPYLALQRILDAAHPRGLRCYQDSLYLDELSDEAITTLTERMRNKNSPLSTVNMFPLDGAYQDASDQDTAWGGSRSGYVVMIIGMAPTPELLDADRRWVRSLWQALLPHARGIGGYLNSVTELEDYRVRASYGPATFERLARVKASYDPENVFHHNANITPAPAPG
ncbi:MAG: BBE domain-containing protein, partial [Pseudonocardiaceae bacterium]